MARKSHRELVKGWYPYTEEECARYTKNGYWMNLTTIDLLKRNARTMPNKLAFSDGTTEVTWLQLLQRVNRLAIAFLELGMANGDFVVLDLMNTVTAMDITFALNRIGAMPIMCLPRHRKAEVRYEAEHHEAKAIIMPVGEKFDYVGMVEEFKNELPNAKIFLTVGGKAPKGWTAVEDLMKEEVEKKYRDDYLEQFNPLPDDIFVEHLSGGTTGIPKGIPRTYNDQIVQWDTVGRALGMTDESVPLVVLPILHNAPMIGLYGPAIFRGATTIICQTPRPEMMWELIQRYRVTAVWMIPIQMTFWQEGREKMKAYDLSSLKLVIGSAEKVRPELVKWFLDEMGVQFVNCFGMAEGPIIMTRWDNEADAHMHTVGTPIVIDPDAEFRLVDDERKDVPPGQIGEMVSRGPLTFKGYYRADEENKKSFDAEGFMYSGDLMSLRPDGRYVVEGRKKDMIKRAGENVYPNVIEDKLAEMPGVAYCAVIGMPDKKLGEKLCAFVQPAEGITITFDDMIAHFKEIGASVFEFPERFEVVNGWPLTPINKINKRMLRAHITATAVKEGAISKEHGDEYLRKDKLSVDDVLEARVTIDFTGEPS